MMVSWQSLWRGAAIFLTGLAALPLHGSDTGHRVFEGVIDSADAAFGEGLRVDGVFAGSFDWSIGSDGAVDLADLEFTVDEHHVIGWEGRWRSGDAVEVLVSSFPGSEEQALYLRWAVHHGKRGEHPGWLELWFAADSVESLATDFELEGYFRLSAWLDDDWAFAKGWFFSGEGEGTGADPIIRVTFLEGLVASLRAELAGTLERLAQSEETLRQTRAQQSGMVSTIEFLATERQRMESEVERLTDELAIRGALPDRIVDLEATLALMEGDLEQSREENFRLVEALARAEAARLRDREARVQAERVLEAVPAAFTVETPPRATAPLPPRREAVPALLPSGSDTAQALDLSAPESGPPSRASMRRGSLRR